MKKIIGNSLILFLLSFGSYAQDLQLVSAKKSIARFEISNFGVNTVTGSLTGFSGVVRLNPQNLQNAKIEVCVEVSTISTGIDKRDAHLQQEEWFNANAFPRLCFQSYEISRTTNGYKASGTITLKGKTQKISVILQLENNLLKGSFKLNRLDFDIGNDTSTFTVGNEVVINVQCFLNN